MKLKADYVDLPAPDGGQIRTFLATPQATGKYPGIICYSDIFQLTGPMLRSCARLAGYGFVVAAPEIYRRIEPPGRVIPFDDPGRVRGQEDAPKLRSRISIRIAARCSTIYRHTRRWFRGKWALRVFASVAT
jgi:dienelactone hydrolase